MAQPSLLSQHAAMLKDPDTFVQMGNDRQVMAAEKLMRIATGDAPAKACIIEDAG